MSYATILIPGSGAIDAYGTNTSEFKNAVGIYLIVWSLVTFMFTQVEFVIIQVNQLTTLCRIATLRTSVAYIALFIFLGLTLGVLGLSELHNTGSTGYVLRHAHLDLHSHI